MTVSFDLKAGQANTPAMRRSVCVALGLTLAGLPALASAGPIELSEKRDGYWIFDDVDGTIEAGNWFSRAPFLSAYGDLEDGFLAVHADDSQFLIIYTTWTLQGAGGLYQAVANDVEGIGYEHIAPLDAIIPEPYFDDTPNSQFQGFLHLSNWLNFVEEDQSINTAWTYLVFGQELGHAWGSFVHYLQDGTDYDDMLGRSEAHWSFYLNAGNSPMEGHDWVDNEDGTLTAIKHDTFVYSDLDLYLMGLMPAEDVQPWFVIDDVSNCVDSALENLECAPATGHKFSADSYTLDGTPREITIEDVIAAEGPRVPAFGDAPTTFDIAFLLIKRPDEELSEEEMEKLEEIVEFSTTIFEEQTRDIGSINNTTRQDPGGDGDGDGDGESGDGDESGDSGETDASGETGSQGEGDTGSDDESQSGGDDDPGSNDDASGCACRSEGDSGRGGLLFLLPFLPLLKRRRRSGLV